MRGDTGVDGQATAADERDPVEVQADKARSELLRGRTWLGREFLTWLLWRSEDGDTLVEHDGEPVTAVFNTRVVLRGLHGEVVELMAKGTMAPYSLQVRRALLDGLAGRGVLAATVAGDQKSGHRDHQQGGHGEGARGHGGLLIRRVALNLRGAWG